MKIAWHNGSAVWKEWHLIIVAVFMISAKADSKVLGNTSLRVPGVGLLRGSQYGTHGARVFAGIPYARPPIDDLRWRPPSPLPKSEDHIDATNFGPACPQELGSGLILGDENCLTLNIFAPSRRDSSDTLLPVLVWFHGGSYTIGTANINLNGTWGPLYSGEAIAAQGAVLVTVQYRLGALGFLGSSELRNRDASGSTGNYGIQDQRLALQWIRQHISTFGGNPQRVLIFGQSAGAGSVNWHLVAKASHGLFHAAALHSGACSQWASQTWHGSESSFRALLAAVDCRNVTCLLAISAHKLAHATRKVGSQGLGWAPTVDGVEMDDLPCRKMARGEFTKVPIIVGFNRDESMPQGNGVMTEKEFDAVLQGWLPMRLWEPLKAEYSSRYSEWFWAAQHLKADIDVVCPTRRFAHMAQASGASVFAYKFSHQPRFPVELMYGPGIAPRQLWGAFHGAELPFVFGNHRVNTWHMTLSEGDQQLSSTISKHWVTLAKMGKAALGWPPMTGDNSLARQWLLLDSPNISVSEAQILTECDTIDELVSSSLPKPRSRDGLAYTLPEIVI